MDVECVEGTHRGAASLRVCNMESTSYRNIYTAIRRGAMTNPIDHSLVQPKSADSNPVRAALKKSRSATPVDVLESVVRMSEDPAYSHVRRSPMHSRP